MRRLLDSAGGGLSKHPGLPPCCIQVAMASIEGIVRSQLIPPDVQLSGGVVEEPSNVRTCMQAETLETDTTCLAAARALS